MATHRPHCIHVPAGVRSLLRPNRALPIGAGLLVCLLLAYALPRAYLKMLHEYPWDGFVDWTIAQSFWAGEDPYDPAVMLRRNLSRFGGVGHPPTTAFWFLPLANLPLNGMSFVVGVASLALLFAQLFIICRELDLPKPLLLASTWYALTVASPWFFWHISLAQVSVPIAFCLVVAWACLRRHKDVWAGAALGCAATFKFFPGVLVLYLAVSGRRRAFFSSITMFGIVALIMTARLGPRAWFQFFEQQGEISRQWIGHIRNRSFHGILLRMLSDESSTVVTPTAIVLLVTSAIALLALGSALYFVRRNRNAASFDLTFAFFCCVSVFFNVWVWEHYYALLLLPAAIVAVECLRADPALSVPARRLVLLLLFALFAGVEAVGVERLSVLSGRMAALTALEQIELHLRALANFVPWPACAIFALGLLLRSRRSLNQRSVSEPPRTTAAPAVLIEKQRELTP